MLNLINIIAVDGGAGMEPVWGAILVGSLILSFPKAYQFLFSKKWIRIVLVVGMTIFIVVEGSILFNSCSLGIPKNVDYLIVLGARIRGEAPSLVLQYRIDKAYEYLSDNEETKAVLTGGQGPGESITEAEAMKRYLLGKGIESERLILEDKATDTDENLAYAFEIIDEKKEDATITVVTSSFHVLRSKMIAKDLGREVSGIGARTLPYLIPTYYLREFFAVVEELIL